MKKFRPVLVVAALAWLFAVTFSYYIVHKPFSADNVLALADAFANLAAAAALFFLALVLGRRVTRTFEFGSTLEAIALRAGLGLGLISFATFGLGLAGALNRILFWALLFASLILLRDSSAVTWRELRSLGSFRASNFFTVFIGALLLIGLAFALTPPIGWDSQTYHLVEAKHAIALGRIAAPPDIVYFSFPSLGEMLFLAAMLLKSDIAAQLIHFGFFLLTLGAVYSFARRYFNPSVAALAAAILAAVPSLLGVAVSAYVDAILAFYAFAAFYALMIAFERNEPRWYALAGAFAGLAASVKYTALIVPVAIVILILSRWSSVVRRPSFVISYLSFCILFSFPFYLRNLVFTGNPVYPFFFGGTYWDAFRADHFSRFGSGLITTPLKILTAPWDATVLGVDGGDPYSATIGALLLALLPLLLVSIRNSQFAIGTSELRIMFYALLFSAILYFFWLTGIAESKLLIQTRLLFPAFPTLAILAALAFEQLGALNLPQFSLQRFTRLLITVVLGITLLNDALLLVSENPLAYVTGAQSREKFLRGALGDYYAATQYINAQLPSASKTLLLWEPRSYYIARDTQPDVLLDSFPHTLSQTRDADAIVRAWRAAGYTHVLLYRRGLNLLVTTQYDPVSLDDVRVLQTILGRSARLVYGEPLDVAQNEIARADAVPYAVYALEPQ